MNARAVLVSALSAAVVLPGCGFTRRYVDKPWGKGTYIPAAVCAVVGGGAGVGIQEARRGTSTGTINGNTISKTDDPEYWKGAVVGAAAGAIVCALVGHYFLDPEVVTPTPPPTPPPTPMPTPPPPPLPTSKHIVLRGVQFDFNKSDIRVDSRPVLDAGADVLKENRNVRISVEGHTDGIGSDEYNQKLSMRRAEAVFRYLVNHGVVPERMEVVGYGKTRPVASNDTEDGRAQNRRVELHVANQPPPASE